MKAASRAVAWFWPAWIAAIVFLFPIPHTVALRNLLLLAGLVALLATWRQAARPSPAAELKAAAWGLAATTAWLLLQSFAVAPAPTLALDNLRGDWLLPLLTGALAAFVAARAGARPALLAIVAALLAHMIWVLGWQLWHRIADGPSWIWIAGHVPFAERDYQSSLNGFLLALLLAERLGTVSLGRVGALLPTRAAWSMLAVSLVADAALRARNGTLVSLLLLLVAVIWMAWRRPRFVALLLVVAGLGAASLVLDPRWSGLQESLGVGWNSPGLNWLSGEEAPLPPTPSGAPLERSAYVRAAWAHQAVEAIGKHPLGMGFGRDGFGRAIEEKYGFPGMVSSHSGWLDFALGAGLPGLALLLISASLALRGAWRQFCRHDDGAALMLCFLVGSYLLRCLLDGHLSGWRLGLFAFICGVLVAAMKDPRRQT